ncbi:carbonic anhydrase-related protein 10-like [Mytilus galloprovincialis]|uniref:carbonic anhydrase-related protein 10-like n=1 Tax=Mytilus galloprovincialis TaxID=29158 RepID=UPI003F7C7B81
MRISFVIITIFGANSVLGSGSFWQKWWTYEGVSGAENWGKTIDEWLICSNGKFQSPIDINTSHLLYDPNLDPFYIIPRKVSGNITNTGRGITVDVEDGPIVFSGPLKYRHKIAQLKVHFGRNHSQGSEHSIDGRSFPAEIHLITYNVDLYHNLSQALDSFQGVAIIAIFCKYGVPSNEAFQLMSKYTEIVRLKGQRTTISGIPLEILFPNTDQYVTYHGSLTTPGCSESVTWIVLNRPINVKQEHLDRFRHLSKGILGGPEAYLEHNVRPAMPSYDRLIKTNINFYQKTRQCNMKINTQYGMYGKDVEHGKFRSPNDVDSRFVVYCVIKSGKFRIPGNLIIESIDEQELCANVAYQTDVGEDYIIGLTPQLSGFMKYANVYPLHSSAFPPTVENLQILKGICELQQWSDPETTSRGKCPNLRSIDDECKSLTPPPPTKTQPPPDRNWFDLILDAFSRGANTKVDYLNTIILLSISLMYILLK